MASSRRLVRGTTIAAIATILLCSPTARAETANDSERADKLFAEANKLIEAGDYPAACPKFEESHRLDPAIGTEFNLALCQIKIGRLGSAYRHLLAVQRVAHTSGKKPREDAAKEKLAELLPHVPHLVIHTEEESPTVKVDGERIEVSDASFYAVDPGEHVVDVSAPTKKPWHVSVTSPAASLTTPGAAVRVDVPKLEIDQLVVTREKSNPRRTVAYVAGGVGLVAVAATAVTGAMMLSAKSTADDHCPPDATGKKVCNDADGRDAVSRGKTLGPINAVAAGLAVVGLGVGTYLFFTSRKSASTAGWIEVQPYAGTNEAGVTGRF